MSEKVGKHKGAVETLMHEQKELSRLLQIVQGQLERHMNALDEAGVDTEKFIEQLQEEQSGSQQSEASEQRSRNNSQQEQKARGNQNKRSPAAEGSKDEADSSSSEDVDDFLEGEDDEQDFAPF